MMRRVLVRANLRRAAQTATDPSVRMIRQARSYDVTWRGLIADADRLDAEQGIRRALKFPTFTVSAEMLGPVGPDMVAVAYAQVEQAVLSAARAQFRQAAR